MLGEHAIVIGGSMAGLLTARVLSDYFERVTIFEANTPPEEAVPRKGVPQGNHIHGLLSGGAAVLCKYFPDIHDDLIAAGADYGDPTIKWRMFMGGTWNPRIASGMTSYVMSRPLLEATVRKHTLAIANIKLCVASTVSAYTSNDKNTAVTGVTLEASGENIAADFVADVSGRNSKASDWIKQMGCTPPPRSNIGIDVGYSTFEVTEPPNYQRDWNMIFIIPQSIPRDTRAGGIFCVENKRWLITASGYHKDYPPTDWSGFLAFLKTHSFPDIYEAIKDLKPVGEAKEYRYAACLRRHYESLEDFPQGLLVLGDAMCSFNPVYGQGMTVASKEVEHLDNCLQQCVNNGNLTSVAQPFFKGAAKIVDAAWDATTVEDFRYPQTRGDRPKAYGLAKWLNRKFFALAATDEEFAVAFYKTLHLVEPPEALLKPKYLLKAAFAKKPVYDQSPPANIGGN